MSILRLALCALALALLAVSQAALEHPIEHLDASHEDGALCDVLDALTACAPGSATAAPPTFSQYLVPFYPAAAPLAAEAPPFLSQGPPVPV